MKMNRIVVGAVLVSMMINTTFSMEYGGYGTSSVRSGQWGYQKKTDDASLPIALQVARIGVPLATLALTMGIPVGKLVYQARAYGGLGVVAAAWRYEIERGRDMLVLKHAAQKDDQTLRNDLLLLNQTLLGDNWRQIRPQLVDDFVDLNRFSFIARHSAEMRERLLYLFNIYAAASDLYFRRYNPLTYLQPYFFTTTTGKARAMNQLDRKLGIESNILR